MGFAPPYHLALPISSLRLDPLAFKTGCRSPGPHTPIERMMKMIPSRYVFIDVPYYTSIDKPHRYRPTIILFHLRQAPLHSVHAHSVSSDGENESVSTNGHLDPLMSLGPPSREIDDQKLNKPGESVNVLKHVR